MYKTYLGIIMTCVVLLSSCASEEQEDRKAVTPPHEQRKSGVMPGTESRQISGEAPAYSVRIKPSVAFSGTVLSAVSRDIDLSSAALQWTINGRTVPSADGRQFGPETLSKGDEVQAMATLNDNTKVFSNTVTIRNSPPEISYVKLMPEVFRAGDTLSVEVRGEDPDGDNVTILYEWTNNGRPAGTGPQIAGQPKRGDNISVTITPFDGEEYGEPGILTRRIQNLPPMIAESDVSSFDNDVYTYQVKASDPDGDPLTYILKSAPPGMRIDPATGMITWAVPADFTGEVPVVVSVTDGHRGETTQELTLTISPAD